MTSEEAQKIIDMTESDCTQKQRFLKGLTILAKYNDNLDSAFEHDQMWTSDFEATVAQMSPEEVKEMARCGWFEDQESWSHY